MLFLGSLALEPPAAHPELSSSLGLATGLAIVAIGIPALVGGTIALVTGRRVGIVVALPGTVLFLVGAFTCPASGHHEWGAWAVGSFGAAFAATALHLTATWRMHRPASA